MDVASAKEARLQIDLLSLLKNAVQIEKLALKSPRITIEWDRDGRLNLENPEAPAATLHAMEWPNLSFSDGTLVYS
jgi:uncharacterized protein involved in outer membrane biogenesis